MDAIILNFVPRHAVAKIKPTPKTLLLHTARNQANKVPRALRIFTILNYIFFLPSVSF